ncbi:MAG: RHS repeat-associated core domain-containing protein, partial [bacterium]
MGYSLKTSLTRPSARPLASPKTHTPLPRLQERGLRFYSPETGRWMSKDPIEEGGGLNLYAGLNNAPTCRIDAWGMRNEPPSTVYFLGYKTVGFVYEGYCGEWNWLIKWIL